MINPFYTQKLATFSHITEEAEVRPYLFMPTSQGITELCAYYSKKYEIDLLHLDLCGKVDSGDNLLNFFRYLHTQMELLDVKEGKARGIVLSHGENHAIPLLLRQHNDALHILIFDSTSGPRMKGFYPVANLFPAARVYLNHGTRQADHGSCITDAICILKEALQIKTIIPLIQSKVDNEHPCYSTGSRFFVPRPENFFIFKMPEQLLFTAQVSRYLIEAEADLDIELRNGHTLRQYREKYVIEVTLVKDEPKVQDVEIVNATNPSEIEKKLAHINSYLYVKSREHKQILDLRWKQYLLEDGMEQRDEGTRSDILISR